VNQVRNSPETLQPVSVLSPSGFAQAYSVFLLSTAASLVFLAEVAYPLVLNKPPFSWWFLLVPSGGLLVFLLAFFPGNLAAMFPCSIDVLPGEGLRLGIPFRKVWIPIGDVLDVDLSSTTLAWRKTYEVELAKSHGLIRNFYISPGFGNQRDALVEAIRRALNQRDST
jgi:hypothetical protein